MQRKRIWLISSILGAVVILVAGLIGGVVLAQGDALPVEKTEHSSFWGRVAAIMGIDQQSLEEAVMQARAEMREEAIHNWLQHKVEQGKITAEQAEEYQQWWDSRPEGICKIKGVMTRVRRGGFREGNFGGFNDMPRGPGIKPFPAR